MWAPYASDDPPYSYATERLGALIERANSASIFDVLNDFAGAGVEFGVKSAKWDCPWNYEHGDGGLDRGFRVYPDTNTAYCFIIHGSMDPVRVVQIQEGVPRAVAAKRVCEKYGLRKPPWRDRYAQLVLEREAAGKIVNSATLGEALHRAIGIDADPWRNPKLAEAFTRALDEMEEVIPLATEAEMRDWYRVAKARLLSLKEERDA